MAQLKNGTSIGGNLAFHAGNIDTLFKTLASLPDSKAGVYKFKTNGLHNFEINGTVEGSGLKLASSLSLVQPQGWTMFHSGSTAPTGAEDGAFSIYNNRVGGYPAFTCLANNNVTVAENLMIGNKYSADKHAAISLAIGQNNTGLNRTGANSFDIMTGGTYQAAISTNGVQFRVPPTINGATMASTATYDGRYLGISAKATDSLLLDGSEKSVSSTANSIAQRDNDGDIHARLFRSSYTAEPNIGGGAGIAFRNNTTDNYIRFCDNAANLRAYLNVYAQSEALAINGTAFNSERVSGFVGHIEANTNSTVLRDVSADVKARLFRSTHQNDNAAFPAGSGIAYRHEAGVGADNYIRFASNPVHIRNFMDVYARGEALAIGGTAVDSTRVGGFTSAISTVGSTVAVRDGSGDIVTRSFRSSFGDEGTLTGSIAFRVNSSTDNYIRFCNNPDSVKTWLGLESVTALATIGW